MFHRLTTVLVFACCCLVPVSVLTTDSADSEEQPILPHCGQSQVHGQDDTEAGEVVEGEQEGPGDGAAESFVRRIIGGEVSKAGEWPWQAALLEFYTYSNQTYYYHFCGGSLINEQWILTAAHCVVYSSKAYTVVRLGEHNLEEDEEHQLNLEIDNIIVHPQYKRYYYYYGESACNFRCNNVTCLEWRQVCDKVADCPDGSDENICRYYRTSDSRGLRLTEFPSMSFDVALIKLKEPVTFGKYVSPICLPDSSEEFPAGTAALVSGWGMSSYTAYESAKVIRHLSVVVHDTNQCADAYAQLFPSSFQFKLQSAITTGRYADGLTRVAGDQICAGSELEDNTACHGDSGGPLVTFRDQRWTLIGAVSWGVGGCRMEGKPAVYARVQYFMPWIEQTVADN